MLPFLSRCRTKQKQSWGKHRANPLVLECLEGRLTPAIGGFDPNTGLVWLEYTSTTMDVETVTLTNNGTNITATGNVSGTTDFTTSSVKGFRVWSSGGGGAQILTIAGTSGYSLPSGVQCVYGIDSLAINAAVSTDTSDFSVATWKGVAITAPVTTTTGTISITANIYTLKGPGNYSGVSISSDVTTGSGNISIVGQGGSDASGQQCGILIGNSAKVFAGGNGSVSLSGTGGANAGTNNQGVYITGSSTVQTGGSGSISINGVGGEVSNYGNVGVLINSGSRITSLGTGNIDISGNGGQSPGTINPGVRIADANTVIRSNGGTISITGSGGSGSPESGKQASDYNVVVEGGASVSPGSAGSGDTVADAYNSNNDVLAIDLAKPLALAAGTYKASSFNRQLASLAPSESSGFITPTLVIAQGSGYVPIAVGTSSSYAGATGFTSAPFGGSDTFTLSQATTVYAAMHWQAPHDVGGPYRMPVGYRSDSGSSRVFYAEGYGAGAALPYVGLACAGTSQATFSRSYDFSITIDPASPPTGGSTPPTSGNLIANGDFSLGNTGFGSQYVLTPGNIGGAQTYDVASSWNVLAYGDHTTGTGKMLGVNGSNIANIVFWHQNVPLTPNTDYTFSFWTSSWFPGATPLAILVDGAAIGTASVPAGTAQWQKFTVDWNSGNRSSAHFSLVATQGFDIGGDFAIDDIELVQSNRQPVVSSMTNRFDTTGDQVSFPTATAFSDPDSDALTFTATGLPDGLSISSAGIISGTIASTSAASSPFITRITASDGRGGSVTGSFTWSVLPFNRNPVTGTLPNRSSRTSDIVNLSVASSFSDPDNDSLTFSAVNLPAGLAMNPNGLITGTVLASGITPPYAVTVTVADGRGGITTGSFSWTINAANMIANGDFSQGNVGFHTQYVYTPGNIGGAQTYDVASRLNVIGYGDHTTGNGNMLAVNGSNRANVLVWSQSVAVIPDTDYRFSLWSSSWFPQSPAPLGIRFNDTQVGVAQAPSTVGQWREFTTTWNSGNLTSLTIFIFNNQGADIGGDFALDDISLASGSNAPPPDPGSSNSGNNTTPANPDSSGVWTSGPGNIEASAADGANDVLAIDLNKPVTLAAGTYRASTFSSQFSTFGPGTPTIGAITPVLLTGSGTTYTPVAVGATTVYTEPTPFGGVPFGGSDVFTLAETTTIYAGMHWKAPHYTGTEYRMPVGFLNDTGSAFVIYGGGTGAGAAIPFVGLPVSGTSQGFFSRTYDFNIGIESVTPPSGGGQIPTPSTANLIVNGDFSQGNSFFGTQYVFTSGNIGGAQTYDVVQNPALSRPNDINPVSYRDHTSGSGNMLAINGSNKPNVTVWSQAVQVAPNTSYTFSFWVSSWFSEYPAPLAILFNGIQIGITQAPSTVARWTQYPVVWNSGDLTAANIAIQTIAGADIGGDFALDDLMLVPEGTSVTPGNGGITPPVTGIKPPVNRPPVVTVPTSATFVTDVSTALRGFRVTDSDTTPVGILNMVLTVGTGILTVGNRQGKSLAFAGTLTGLNRALDLISYTSKIDEANADSLFIKITDSGYRGAAAKSVTKVVSLQPALSTITKINDPGMPGHTSIVVQGSARADSIKVLPGKVADSYQVSIGSTVKTILGINGCILVFGFAGNDTIDLSAVRSISTRLDGGNDNDVIKGGTDTDIIFGGAGTDMLVGGLGIDYLYGMTGNDMLIDGTAVAIGPRDSLASILAIWAMSSTVTPSLQNAIAARLQVTLDNGSRDFLFGFSGSDWFWCINYGDLNDIADTAEGEIRR